VRQFGLIGYPLSHSFSKRYFTEKFEKEGLNNCVYDNFPLVSISELPGMLANNPSLEGFNITIPYKEQVVPFLAEQSAVVRETGACNCVKIKGGRLTGYNTDVTGFELSLKENCPRLVYKTGPRTFVSMIVLLPNLETVSCNITR